MPQNLSPAIAAIKAGDKVTGQRLLTEIIKAEPDNENAWLWLSSAVDSNEQRRYCLQQVLKINPDHKLARRGLTALGEGPIAR